jgi:molybdate transport system substrate-binding protein
MFYRILRKRCCLLIIALVFFGGSFTRAQDLVVMSSGGFAPAYKLLAPEFETASSAHVKSVWGPSMGTTSGAIPMRLSRNEPADVVIMARTELDALAKRGLVVEGSQVDLVRSRIGMAVRTGTAVPDISSVAAFRKTLLQANSIAYSDSASGVYIATELYKRLGLEKELSAKSRQIPAEPIGLVVARGEVEIGFQQISELQPISGITIVGPIPDELQKVTIFAAGVVATSKQQDAARALIRFLAATAACPEITKSALEPVACTPTHK